MRVVVVCLLFIIQNLITPSSSLTMTNESTDEGKLWLLKAFLINRGDKCICTFEDEFQGTKGVDSKTETIDDDKKTVNNDNDNGAEKKNFTMDLCPNNECIKQRRINYRVHRESELTPFQTYGYGTLAVFLISLCSVAGVLLIPCLRSSLYTYIITGFIAFGLGFMMGDALLHLIPEALRSNCVEYVEEESVSLWRSVLIMLTIYGLFTFETVMDLAHHQEKTSHRCPRRHSHSHIPFPEDIISWNEPPISPERSGKESQSGIIETTPFGGREMPPFSAKEPTPSGSRILPPTLTPLVTTGEFTLRDLKPLAVVILLGDAVHNFGDGLAVGAAFTSGLQSGISTSLAIFCHELPHEFGDFVILRSTGLSIQQALLANLVSALTAFLGLFVGVNLGFEQSMRQWIFAFTAAMFLYIAVGDMLPELRNHNKTIGVLAVQSMAMLIGMSVVLLMHLIEHQILDDDHE